MPVRDFYYVSWRRAWDNFGLQSPAGLIERLVAAYIEPDRHYHSLQHLEECIERFSNVMASAKRPGEVEIALWFHDAIYNVRGKTNERDSAAWAIRELAAAGASADVQSRVEQLIMATCHDAVPSDPDQQLLVDIDLSILGASPERFKEYDLQVRREYSWVPGFLYKMKRKEVLRSFLAREYIYSTAVFRQRYEAQARANLRGAID